TADAQLSAPWPSEPSSGNLAVGPGVLYSLSSNQGGSTLVGLCDWTSLEERLLRDFQRDPNDVDLACAWADFLVSRANLEHREGRTAKALAYFGRLRAALEPLLDANAPTAKPELAARLHAALVGEARSLADLADVRGAVERLERSRGFAIEPAERRDTLWALANLARDRDRARYRALLVELDAAAGELPLPRETSASPSGGDEVAAAEPDPSEARDTIGIWVQRELVQLARTDGDLALEFGALHELLARYGDARVSPNGERVADRIGALVGRTPPKEYAPFEAHARTLLDEAIAAGDLESLTRVRELYPHSKAAAAAVESALAIATDKQRLDLYAAEFASSLSAHWSFARAEPVELGRVADFAGLALHIGERELARALCMRLEPFTPDRVVDRSTTPPQTVATLARALAGEPGPAAAERVDFDDTIRPHGGRSNGPWNLLGYLPLAPGAPADGPRHLVTSTRGWIDVWRSGSPPERLCHYRIDPPADPEVRPNRVLFGADRVVIGLADRVVGVDVTEPSEAWELTADGESIEALVGADGVAIAATQDRTRGYTLHAVSIELGQELWTRELGLDVTLPPLVGEGRVVVLPRGRGVRSAQVFDLFVGTQTASFELDADTWENDGRSAWIEQGKVLLPAFRRNARSTNEMLRAFDLESGVKRWTVPVESGRELQTVIRAAGRTYLVLAADATAGRLQSGGILELDTGLGALRAIQNAKLGPGDLLIGVPRLAVVELDTPFVFVRGEAPGVREAVLRAIHLPYGERWSTRLSVPIEAFYNGAMPRPVVSQSTVALVYGEHTRTRDGEATDRTSLVLFDRASGQRRDLRTLDRALGRSDSLELGGLGSALFVAGSGGMDVLSK
ncbi:MAG: PQQ-like beta-propeller repeat protein, partial [Planctomycetes bacterium]|nr:PQQ-like beta-propeller repeat protein [Planctomycetota bacterium]